MKYRFETLEDARKFASTKINLATHEDYPVQTKRYYVVTVLGDKFVDGVSL